MTGLVPFTSRSSILPVPGGREKGYPCEFLSLKTNLSLVCRFLKLERIWRGISAAFASGKHADPLLPRFQPRKEFAVRAWRAREEAKVAKRGGLRFARPSGFLPWFPGHEALDLVIGTDAAEGRLARVGLADVDKRSRRRPAAVLRFFGRGSKTDLEIRDYGIESVMSGSKGSSLSGIGSGASPEAGRP
jgi:hypothetical protein